MNALIDFQTDPSRYRHWRIEIDGPVASLVMDVDPAGGLFDGYELKLNSYDLGVDIELHDAVQRLRFEHPEVGAVVIRSGKPGVFCAGANIRMLSKATHGHKVNFCKFTNETRMAIEDATENSGQTYIAAVSGTAAGGGYELAVTAEHIMLIDDRRSTVSLPELPLLAVLPGTGGLTRVTDKRRVRRDRADVFCSTEEGVRGSRAVAWRLVDEVVPPSRWDDTVTARAREVAARGHRPAEAQGVMLLPLNRQLDGSAITYSRQQTGPSPAGGRGEGGPTAEGLPADAAPAGHRHPHPGPLPPAGDDASTGPLLRVALDRARGIATLTVMGPSEPPPADAAAAQAQGCAFWPLALARALDDAILHLRTNEPELGVWVFRTEGDAGRVLAYDALIDGNQGHWLMREVRHFLKRVLKRLDVTSRSLIALVEPGSCFAGTLAELAFAADRSAIFVGSRAGDNRPPAAITLGAVNFGPLPMGNGLTRLQTRFLGEADSLAAAEAAIGRALDGEAADEAGLVTYAYDETDWDDEIRIMLEERASFSPDSLTGLEANLRFAGPETMETRIFGRLTAWQNWIFQRPNAVGEDGALKRYGSGQRAVFDRNRV